MSLVELLVALALAYQFSWGREDLLRAFMLRFASVLERNFNDGDAGHGAIAAVLAVILPVALAAAAYLIALGFSALLGMLVAIVLLYFSVRFSRFGAPAERMAQALRDQNLEGARAELALWQSCNTDAYGEREIARSGIEATLRHAHHDLIAPLFWFLIAGPAGALLYRLAYLLRQLWAGQHADFRRFSQQMFSVLDWLPARFTAACFAIMGDFEDAIFCWRTQSASWADPATGIVLASGAGALGVKLGEALPCNGVLQYRPELGLGDEADADYLGSAVGLVWRVLVLISGILLLLTFASWLGG